MEKLQDLSTLITCYDNRAHIPWKECLVVIDITTKTFSVYWCKNMSL